MMTKAQAQKLSDKIIADHDGSVKFTMAQGAARTLLEVVEYAGTYMESVDDAALLEDAMNVLSANLGDAYIADAIA